MARYGVTYDEVATAAQQLIAQGRSPTIESIRAITAGSSTTIANHFRHFKERQHQNKTTPSKENIPAELMSFVQGLWEKVMSHAEQCIEKIKNDVTEEIAQLTAAVETLTKENTRWQQDYEVSQTQKAALLSDKTALEQHTIELQKQMVGLQTSLGAANQQAQDKQAHIAELTRLNQQIQSNLEHFREASREQRLIDQAKFENEKNQLTQTIHELKQQQQAQQHTYLVLQEKYNNLTVQHEKLTVNHENNQMQLSQTQVSLLKIENESVACKQELNITLTKLAEAQTIHAELAHKTTHLTENITTLKADLAVLTDQNKRQALEKWEISQEKAVLEGQLKQMQAMLNSTTLLEKQ